MPADTKPFEFTVKTLEVNFEVNAGGLNVEYDKDELMNLSGSIATSDSEQREKLEKILTATLDGKPVPSRGSGGDRNYGFAIPNILRKASRNRSSRCTGTARRSASTQQGREEHARAGARRVRGDAGRRGGGERPARRSAAFLVGHRHAPGSQGPDPRSRRASSRRGIQNNVLTLYMNEDVVGKVTLTLEEALRSRAAVALSGERTFELEFTNTKPQVRFVGQGVILPDAKTLTVPFEAVSARAVRVTALQVFENNIPQFLQVNKLVGHAGAGPRRPRAVAQDDPAHLAGARAAGRATTSTSRSSCANIRAGCSS